MTDEEKKALEEKAKAEVQQKNDQSTKDKTEDNSESEGEDEGEDDPQVLKAALAKARKEAAARRVENKTLKAEKERQDKALAILQGKDKPDLDPVEQAKKSTDERMRRMLIKAELGSVARDAHDPNDLFAIIGPKLKDIEVDLESETVDSEGLKSAVQEVRKNKPWMFQSAGDKSNSVTKGGSLPPDKGTPKGGVDHKAEWQKLLKQNRTAEAQKYYSENKAAILTNLT